MPFVPAPNLCQVEVRALLDSQHIENRFTIDLLAPVTETNLTAATTAVFNWCQDTYFPLLPHNVTLTEVVGTDLSVVDGPQVTESPSTPTAGAIAANALPNEVTLCISLRTGNRGRSARGRSYVLALPTDEVSGNNVASAFAALLVGAFETLRSDISTAGFAWVVASYIHDNAPRSGGPVYYIINSVLVTDLTVDSMRKRKPGVGS